MVITVKSKIKPPKVRLKDIVNKLNYLVDDNTEDSPKFFYVKTSRSLGDGNDETIYFRSNSNLETHTKLIAIIILYLANRKYPFEEGYVSIGGVTWTEGGTKNHGEDSYIMIYSQCYDRFMKFLDSLGRDVSKIEIKLEY